MATNPLLRTRAEETIDWSSRVDTSRIGVAAEGGLVLLTGHVPSIYQSVEAEHAVLRVDGVRGLDNALDIDLPNDEYRTDTDITEDGRPRRLCGAGRDREHTQACDALGPLARSAPESIARPRVAPPRPMRVRGEDCNAPNTSA